MAQKLQQNNPEMKVKYADIKQFENKSGGIVRRWKGIDEGVWEIIKERRIDIT